MPPSDATSAVGHPRMRIRPLPALEVLDIRSRNRRCSPHVYDAAGRRLRHQGGARRGARRIARRHRSWRWRTRGTRAARRSRRRTAAVALRRGWRAGTSRRGHCPRWLRPPASLPSLRHRFTAAVRRPHRAGGGALPSRVSASALGCGSGGGASGTRAGRIRGPGDGQS